ncbi:tetratricopeptide repeat protein [uncultured Sunxiuqinia sp.]|uniref:tetratricopeptide repeat protein n=1 Tax=uncultured Sunxiuqinia sp. TaxID=1573825 RepID=UPI002AA6DE1B|nr:tetratricopeptide repeat protein [uncultured Sunxiuqinia sp.]
MKPLLSKTFLLTIAIVVITGFSSIAQRVIKGTVYREGEPAAGVTVEAHKSNDTFMTSFDGKYEIEADEKSKYLRFTFIDDSRKFDIEGNSSNKIDFSFDGEIPTGGATADESGDVDLRTSQELVKAKDRDFMNNLSMYDQFYKQDDYKSAMKPWRMVYNKYPKSTLNLYIHGSNMYEYLINNTEDWDQKNAYIDSLISIYDRRIKYFNQKGYVRGRQGTDLLKFKLANENLDDDQLKSILKTGYGYLEESINLQKKESEVAVLVVFMQATKRLFIMGELPKDQVAANYQTASDIINNYLKTEPESEKYLTAKDLVDRLFQTSGAADCEALISLYEPQYDEIIQNVDDLKKMLRILDRRDCTDSELFATASEKLYDLEPSAEAAFNMARLFVKRDQFDRAKEYYQNAIKSETDKELLAKYYYELGLFIFAKENDFQKARDLARKAIQNNPNSGRAYILLGDIYAQYSKYYGESDFEHASLYWLAVDYYQKAKRVDPDVFASANEKIAIYKRYFPDKETMFFQGFQEGQSYTIGSWINETTKARVK